MELRAPVAAVQVVLVQVVLAITAVTVGLLRQRVLAGQPSFTLGAVGVIAMVCLHRRRLVGLEVVRQPQHKKEAQATAE
jgi:hypothetical protein